MIRDENPFAPPDRPTAAAGEAVATDPAVDGPWRDGDLLVVTRWSRLPDRCVRCGATATSRFRSRHREVPGRARPLDLEYGLCRRHANRSRWWIYGLGWLVLFAAVEGPLALLSNLEVIPWYVPGVAALGLMLMIEVLVLLWPAIQASRLRVIDAHDETFWLDRMHPDALDGLPDWPGGDRGPGPWREGDLLVVGPRSKLPDRCIRCDAAMTARVGLGEPSPSYLRGSAVGLCDRHRRRRRYAQIGDAAMAVLSFAVLMVMPSGLFVAGGPLALLWGYGAGSAVIVTVFVLWKRTARRLVPLSIHSIRDGVVRLEGASPWYLDRLEPWPG